jgi:hypothetical protein
MAARRGEYAHWPKSIANSLGLTAFLLSPAVRSAGLKRSPRALGQGDIVHAQIAAVLLQIPDPPGLTESQGGGGQASDLARLLGAGGLLGAARPSSRGCNGRVIASISTTKTMTNVADSRPRRRQLSRDQNGREGSRSRPGLRQGPSQTLTRRVSLILRDGKRTMRNVLQKRKAYGRLQTVPASTGDV